MKTAADPRHKRRQKIVQELFAWQAQATTKTPISELPANSDDKTKRIVTLVKKIDEIIGRSAPEWEIDKINQIDLAILRQAVHELFFEEETPGKVVIDEAVELAKEFGNENSPSFVNGALGKAFASPERVARLIAAKLGGDPETVTPESELRSELNATDLEISDLILILEKEYNFTAEPGMKFLTVGDLTGYIEDRLE